MQYTMITGLCMQAIFGFALSGAYYRLVPDHIAGFAVMYGIFLSFGVSRVADSSLAVELTSAAGIRTRK